MRLNKNLELLHKITDFISNHPNYRFIQALWAMGIIDKEDRFYEESDQTLKRIE
jgi:hypothetical protein